MIKFISFLRGINIGGHKIIKMADLRKLYEDIGFTNVISYIQSGNLLFDSEKADIQSLINMIQKGVKERFKIDVSVIIKTSKELKAIIDDNPMHNINQDNISKMSITLFNKKIAAGSEKLLFQNKSTSDKFKITNNGIYLFCPNGFKRTVYTNNFFEKRLNLAATTRNLRTINKLYELSLKN